MRMARAPVVISFTQAGIKDRDLMLGISPSGRAAHSPIRAF